MMHLSDKTFNTILTCFLVLLGSSFIFRIPATWFIILFCLFNLFFFKKLQYNKQLLIPGLVIAIPFLLEILFFWNNQKPLTGIKTLEKSLSLLVFPLFILAHHNRINMKRILPYYSLSTTAVVFLMLLRFIIKFPHLVQKYLEGRDLWESGYKFAWSFGIHAPALNMHLSFASIVNLYFLFESIKRQKANATKAVFFLGFIVSFFLILIVNTRMALFDVLVGYALISFSEMALKYSVKKIVTTSTILLVALSGVFVIYFKNNAYMREKYTKVTFAHIDKIGKLDEIENPEKEVFSALVTRITIWQLTTELALKNLPFGTGSADAKPELFKYYREKHQHFLSKYNFPVHNQYLDFFLRYGVFGLLGVFLFIGNFIYLGLRTNNTIIICFFIVFFTSNLMDDYLVRFDGITFSAFWGSIFSVYYLQKINRDKISLLQPRPINSH